jgi:hypothetical protein
MGHREAPGGWLKAVRALGSWRTLPAGQTRLGRHRQAGAYSNRRHFLIQTVPVGAMPESWKSTSLSLAIT